MLYFNQNIQINIFFQNSLQILLKITGIYFLHGVPKERL